MTNKSTSFKRIALALVAALGFGVLSSGPSNALLSDASTTLSLSASSATVAQGETATVTATVNFTSTELNESVSVLVGDVSGVTEVAQGLTTDSINVSTKTQGDALPALDYAATRANRFSVFGSTNPDSSVAVNSGAGMYIYSAAAVTTPVAVQAKINLVFRVDDNKAAGVHTYTVVLRTFNNSSASNKATATFTLTTTTPDLTATAAKSLLWVNGDGVDLSGAVGTTSGYTHGGLAADSALVVSANTALTGAQTFTAVGGIWASWRNAADTNVAGPLANKQAVTGSIVLNISGAGLLSKPDRIGGAGTRSNTVTLTQGETAIIWSNGTAGTATITGSIGGVNLTQAAKTVTFFGKVATLTAADTTPIAMGAPSLSSNVADSVTVGSRIMAVTAKDTAGNVVKSAAMNGPYGNLYCHSSDTSVASLDTTSTGGTSGTATDSTAPSTSGWVAAQAPSSIESTWVCNVRPLKEGTVTITMADDTVLANATITAAKSYTFAKSVGGTTAGFKGKGTITFDKATYNVGEKAEITVTVLNATGNVPGAVSTAGDAAGTVFSGLTQNRPFSSIGRGTSNVALGFGTARDETTFSMTGGTFFKGVETYTVYMPTTAGDLTITGFTTDGTYDTATAVSVTIKVVDPNAALISAAQAAAVAAADAATDAALEAIDAANAATDAANLAAEAADAATVAAEEARDAADAATAAVEALATEVATMMAALKAQITTLARTVAKIAKKVNA